MKLSILLTLALCFTLSVPSFAATLLASHQGSADPLTENWTGTSITNTNVIVSPYDDNGRAVWSVYDPGLAPGGKSNNGYYQAKMTDTHLQSMLALGWEMSVTASIPGFTTENSQVWGSDSSSWIGFYHKNATSPTTIDSYSGRRIWALMLGRDNTGKTVVTLYQSGIASKVIDAGYHDYSMVYNPTTKLASVYIDGKFWAEYAGSTSTGVTENIIYWGDNASQGAANNLQRTTYYESVQLSIVPEPTRLVLSFAALCVLFYRRSRRPL